jgi:WD40 repeat protein
MPFFTSVAWHPDGQHIAGACGGGHVLIWDADTGMLLKTLEGYDINNPSAHDKIVWSPKGDRLAAGYAGGRIIVWDSSTGQRLNEFRGHSPTMQSLSWSPDGHRLLSLGKDDTIRVWDIETGRDLLTLPMPNRASGRPSVKWNPDGRSFGAASRELRIFDASIGYEHATALEAEVRGK